MNDSKLEKVLPKINTLLEKIEKNTKMSYDKKDKIISQLVALKEIIEEKFEDSTVEADIDLEGLLD